MSLEYNRFTPPINDQGTIVTKTSRYSSSASPAARVALVRRPLEHCPRSPYSESARLALHSHGPRATPARSRVGQNVPQQRIHRRVNSFVGCRRCLKPPNEIELLYECVDFFVADRSRLKHIHTHTHTHSMLPFFTNTLIIPSNQTCWP